MATIAVAKVSGADKVHARTYLWETLVTGSLDGESIELPDHADKSVQVVGTFNTATIALQGSNDGTNWVSLSDPQGNAIEMTSAGLKQILENTRFVRPLVTSVGASTDVDVFLHVRANR